MSETPLQDKRFDKFFSLDRVRRGTTIVSKSLELSQHLPSRPRILELSRGGRDSKVGNVPIDFIQ